jgi:hypothetical protein
MCNMPRQLVLEQVSAIPVSIEDAFRATLMQLPTVCRHRYGLIPPITGVTGNEGEWGTVGSSRTLVLRGSGSVREELVHVDRPHSFGYTMSHITGPLSTVVSWIQGEFVFTPAGTGTRITWRYILHARSALTGVALPVIGWSWRGYARQALEELSEVVVA